MIEPGEARGCGHAAAPDAPPAAPRFPLAARVRVDARIRPGHIRTPLYLLGKRGRIVAFQGAYEHAERLAYAERGPRVPLYLVEFAAEEVWGAQVAKAERRHKLLAEIYEDWLAPERAPGSEQ